MICKACGMGQPNDAVRCNNCGASLIGMSQGLTQSDVFWAVFKALLAVALILGVLSAIGLLIIYGPGALGL